MKTATVLFGLCVATGVAHANPAAALVKRAATPVTTAATALTPVAAPVTARVLPGPLVALLRARPAPLTEVTRAVEPLRVERPLVDDDGDVAPGNVMKKTKK